MIQSILPADQEKLNSIEGNPAKLTPYERNILNDLVEVLTPFEEATDFSNRTPSISRLCNPLHSQVRIPTKRHVIEI